MDLTDRSEAEQRDVRTSIQTVLIVFGFGALGIFMGLTALLF